jgi:bifunctional polynucleotide phosphatase/kinase
MSRSYEKSEKNTKKQDRVKWRKIECGSYMYGVYKNAKTTSKSKVAGFDLDDTLIRPTGNKKFSTSHSDWQFYNDNVVSKLEELYEDDYVIVIVSNQKGVSTGKVTKYTLKKKIQLFAKQIKIPFIILMATHDDLYRKPRTQMWSNHIKCDKTHSFFCGDAGGLLEDFSDTDRKFALNLNIQYMHRDEWLNEIPSDEEYDWDDTEDIRYNVDFDQIKTGKYDDFEKPKYQELVINVGFPGSGKSFYTNNYVLDNEYAYVNQDTLRTQIKCLKECEAQLKDNKSVVIDNTNLTSVIRKKYIDLAKKYKVKCRCLYFTASMDISRHNNILRNIMTEGDTKIIPKVAYYKFRKQFEEPQKKEGFYKIEKIEFILDTDKISWEMFKQYLD